MEFIDTHSHLFVEQFDEDRDLVVQRARSAGVKHLFLPNIDGDSVQALLHTVAEYPGYCTPMVGLHPTSVNASYEVELDNIHTLLIENKGFFAAIGEVGVDLYWDRTFRQQQLHAFSQQIVWAKELGLPLAIHSREAFAETYETVSSHAGEGLSGVFHSFGGSREEAEKLLSIPDFYLGINGVVTFKKSTLPQVLRQVVPLERVVLETDCPYLAPVPYRGKRNESSYLPLVAERLAQVYEVPVAVVAQVTTQNAEKLFQKSTASLADFR